MGYSILSQTEGAPGQGRKAGVRHLSQWIAPLISLGLITWLIWRVSPSSLVQAFAQQDLRFLIPATGIFVITLYVWETFCLQWLYSQPNMPLLYSSVLRARGTSYLAGVFNYEAGQATFAWLMARIQKISLISSLSRCILMALHDVMVLLALGLLGSLASSDPRAGTIQIVCGTGLLALITGGILVGQLPSTWRTRILKTRRAPGSIGGNGGIRPGCACCVSPITRS